MAFQRLQSLLGLSALVAFPLAAVPLVMAQTAPDGGAGAAGQASGGPSAAGVPAPLPAAAGVAPAPVGQAAAPGSVAAPSADRPPAVPPPLVPGPLAPAAPTAVTAPGLPMPAASPRLLPNSAATQSVPAPLQPDRAQRQSLPSKRFDASLEDLMRDGVVRRREVRVHAGLIANPDLLRQGCSTGAFSARECGASDGGVQFRARADGGGGVAYGFSGGAGGERYGTDAAPLPPISVPVTALLSGAGGSFRLTDVFQRTPRPASIRGNSNARPIFPLIGGAEISSGFGWRLHPILGTWMMHSGRDLAAPEGTPVVATLSGRVVSSGDAGGYGLAIELEHDNPRRRTLYGHLSELYVKEGERIRQGEVIGRVGSTGRSTGPHLHFELRMPQEGGWVAVDPGELDPGGGVQVAAGALPGLAGLLASASGAPTDAVALLMGQLIQSLERPRSPLATVGEAGGSGLASPAASSDRLPQRLPAAAALPGPAPLPRNLPATPIPGRAPSQRPNQDG